MEVLLLLLVPSLSIIACAIHPRKKFMDTVNIAATGLVMGISLYIGSLIIGRGTIQYGLLNHCIHIDAFSALILMVTTMIFFLGSLYTAGYLADELHKGAVNLRRIQLFYIFFNAFLLSILVGLITQNLGVMWIAIEATTLSSAFLVGFYNRKNAIEAAWKYIIICSVGIAIALFGIIMLYFSSLPAFKHSPEGFNWLYLIKNAAGLDKGLVKIAFVMILIGFGTKAGLAPMHTWLPDAHSQAPAPISALLSGVLLNIAIYGIIRVTIIANKTLGNTWFTGRLLIILGLVSIGLAAVFILVQRDYKRLLAYSSIEHMGIIAFGMGLMTPLSIFGALYHTLNHAFTKSMLFMASGNVYLGYESRRMAKIKHLVKVMPVTGVVFFLGLFAITGMPPFGIFGSELAIVLAGFKTANYLVVALFLVLVVVVFAGIIKQMTPMFFGGGNNPPEPMEFKESRLGSGVLILALIMIMILGVYLPQPVMAILNSARRIIMGGALS
jgi:hydrogenase-4 component F